MVEGLGHGYWGSVMPSHGALLSILWVGEECGW